MFERLDSSVDKPAFLRHLGLFDATFYLDQYPDVRRSGVDPVEHYLERGAAEGRDPHPWFSTRWYCAKYHDIDPSRANPLVHFGISGWRERRDPGPWFDTGWYLNEHKEVAVAEINPLSHFLRYGLDQGLATHPQLGSDHYLARPHNPAQQHVAVMLHAFYDDLLEELLEATARIPIPCDILLTAVSESTIEHARDWLARRPHLRVRFRPRLVENRGRDIAPFVAAWGQDLLGYDLACHIHTKKSLYSGRERWGWRQYLLHNLLGSPSIVMKNLATFYADPKLGVLYPETHSDVPYMAHTWLSNQHSGRLLHDRLGLSVSLSSYIDFPAGSMFWFRPAAIHQMLDGRLTMDDFPIESGQNDGTLSHAVERSFVLLARSNGYRSIEFNADTGYRSVDWGQKRLCDYRARGLRHLLKDIDEAEVVSFDIFDTLLTRSVTLPDQVHTLVQHRLDVDAGRPTYFQRLRKDAEARVRQSKRAGDVSYDEIYEVLRQGTLGEQLATRAETLELEIEEQVSVPRLRVIEAFRYAVTRGKRVLLVSDMYLRSRHVERLLAKAGVRGHSAIYMSSEIGVRKDTGAMWDYLIAHEGIADRRFLHIGDNEHSDVQMVGDRRLGLFHVMSPYNLFMLSMLGRKLAGEVGMSRTPDALYLGPVIAQRFNDPFEGR
ncbi:MAG: hypothetical protein IT381_00555 [Deltaproteobacteria bacterium]|nr:hypothetical protein [Deltaproteobacteria bacterium]